MASGTLSLGTSGTMEGRIVWSSTSNGTAANNSTVSASLQVRRTDTYTTTGTWTGRLEVGGTVESYSWYGGVSSSWVTVKSLTITRSHSNDGTGNCWLYGLVNGPSGTSQSGRSVAGSATVTLDTIPRMASIKSAPNFTDEDNPTITYNNPAGSAVDSLDACISLTGEYEDVPYRDIEIDGTSYTFNLTDEERDTLRTACGDATERVVIFFVRTVINGTTYHSTLEKTFSIINADPTLSPTVEDSNATTKALTGDSSKFVKGYSDAKFTIGAAAVKCGTLKSQIVVCGSKSSALSSGTLSDVESATFKFTATDNRGNSATKTLTKTLINYVKLTCNLSTNNPTVDGDMAFKISGNYFNGSFGSTANALTVQYRVAENDGDYGSWVTVTPTLSGNTYSVTVNLTGLDYQTKYTFQARAVDKLITGGVSSATRSVKAMPVFDWGENDFTVRVLLNAFGSVCLAKLGAYFGKNPDGENRALVQINEDGDTLFGYESYKYAEGATYYDGNEVNIRSKAGAYHNGNPLASFPVGAVYISYVSTSPAELFGGTWTAITGKFPYFNAGTATGGSNTHTLTIAQMPSHSHYIYNMRYADYSAGTTYGHVSDWNLHDSDVMYTDPVGGGGSHNNMPAYQTLYAWRRTA